MILDYGPAYSTWCFSFERYNHVLETTITNDKSVESQFMGHFMKSQAVTSLREKINDDELLNIAPANDEISTPTPST